MATPTAGTPTGSPAAATPRAVAQHVAVSVSRSVTIRMTDQGFVPDYVEATNGHDLTITLVNAGTRVHGFTIEHFGISVSLAPGKTQTVTITSPDLGDYSYSSDAPGDEGMQGKLTFYI